MQHNDELAASQDPLVASWRGIYPQEKFTNVFVIGLAGLSIPARRLSPKK